MYSLHCCLFTFSACDQTQGVVNARQVPCHRATPPLHLHYFHVAQACCHGKLGREGAKPVVFWLCQIEHVLQNPAKPLDLPSFLVYRLNLINRYPGTSEYFFFLFVCFLNSTLSFPDKRKIRLPACPVVYLMCSAVRSPLDYLITARVFYKVSRTTVNQAYTFTSKVIV